MIWKECNLPNKSFLGLHLYLQSFSYNWVYVGVITFHFFYSSIKRFVLNMQDNIHCSKLEGDNSTLTPLDKIKFSVACYVM